MFGNVSESVTDAGHSPGHTVLIVLGDSMCLLLRHESITRSLWLASLPELLL